MSVADKEEDIVKELVSPDIPRVDAVTGPAHGAGFLVVKSRDAQDEDTVEKAIHGGTAQGEPGDGSKPSDGPDESDDGTNAENSGADDAARLTNDTEYAAGPTGQTAGSSDARPDTSGVLPYSTDPASAGAARGGIAKSMDDVAEELFQLRKALIESGASDDVIAQVDVVGLSLDNVVKANTGMEAGLDADGDDDGDEPEVDASDEAKKTPTKKSLADDYEVITPEQLSKSLEPVLKSIVEGALAERLAPLEKRLKTVEDTPVSGGPLLNGAASAAQSDYYVVSKSSERPTVAEGQPVEALEKALEVTSDPYLREKLQQEIARRMHPMHSGS